MANQRQPPLGLAIRYDTDPPPMKPMPLGPQLQLKLESATARLPRPRVPIPGTINVEGAMVESWRRRALIDNDGLLAPKPPPVTARARPVVGSGASRPQSAIVPTYLMAQGALLQVPTAANLVERSNFAKRLELPRLGVHLVVDEPKADYIPDRTAHESRRSQQVQRIRRVELSRFLFGKSNSGGASTDDADAEDDTVDVNTVDERTAALHVAEAATMALEALQSLPPGVVESAPYLTHMNQRSEVELRMATVSLQEADEAKLFDAFAQQLRAEGVDANQVDETSMKAKFAEFAVSYVSRKPTDASTKPDTALPDAPPKPIERPQTGRMPQRLRSAQMVRPPSAKFMFSANEKRSFLTELMERAESEQLAVMEEAAKPPPPTSLSPAPAPAASPEKAEPRPKTSQERTNGRGRAASINDIRGPALAPATASAAQTCAVLKLQRESKMQAACMDAFHALDQQHASAERRKQISQLRFNVRSAKKTRDLYRRTNTNQPAAVGELTTGGAVLTLTV